MSAKCQALGYSGEQNREGTKTKTEIMTNEGYNGMVDGGTTLEVKGKTSLKGHG